jgi:hypothetical protein
MLEDKNNDGPQYDSEGEFEKPKDGILFTYSTIPNVF